MRRMIRITQLCCASLAALLALAPAAGAVKKRKIANFQLPVSASAAPGFRKLLFVVEQPGTVRVVKGNRKLRRPFLKIRGLVGYDGSERGLLSIAFPPNYKRSGRFYVFYTDNDGDLRVEEFRRRSPTRARRGSRRLVIEILHREASNHNGGQLQFLGNLLYIGTGDGGGAGDPDENAQNLNSLLGKILRINPRNPRGGAAYSIPSGNPFVGRNGRDEIYSYGLRNPWRFSFDRVRRGGPYLAIGDAGQDRFEEIDYTTVAAASGANFGWDAFEGFAPYPDGSPNPGGTTAPILAYGGGANCAVIGGLVPGKGAPRALRGRYLYSDFCRGQVRKLVPRPGGARRDRPTGVNLDSPSSFGVDNRGRVYVCSLEGPLYRLVRGR
ncbi:MAG: PQQ-dependent sugar dehydrogenase [Solirubrobacterales bacterium]